MKSCVLMAFLMGFVLAGCDLPRDPEKTLETVQGQELRVGVLKFGQNADKDRPIIERLAASLEAKLVYVEGDAHALFEDLRRGHLHLVIGGVPESTPFEKELGLSKPVGPLHGAHEEEDRVIAVRPGENAFLLRVNEVIEAAKAEGAGS
jgi:polar amino acid transport system substrate-binding protein